MAKSDYDLDAQIGFLLRRAYRRHAALFARDMPDDLTPTQFAAMARLLDRGALSQNLLGREIALDAATIKGVVDRLMARGLLQVRPDPDDGRRSLVSLTDEGQSRTVEYIDTASTVNEETLAPLPPEQRVLVIELLTTLAGGPVDSRA